MMEFGEVSIDVKRIGFVTSTKEIKIPLENVLLLEKKTGVIMLDHMPHPCA